MFRYIRSTMGIKEKIDLENTRNDVKQVDEVSGGALVDLGDLSAGNMDALAELGNLAAGNMDALAELGALLADMEARISALEGQTAQ